MPNPPAGCDPGSPHICPLSARGGPVWHLDRKIPIALIAAALFQAASGIWWAASVERRIEMLDRRMSVDIERRVGVVEINMDRAAAAKNQISERLTRIEERSVATNDTVRRIEEMLTAARYGTTAPNGPARRGNKTP